MKEKLNNEKFQDMKQMGNVCVSMNPFSKKKEKVRKRYGYLDFIYLEAHFALHIGYKNF